VVRHRYTLAEGSGYKAATKISDAGVGTRTSKLTKLTQAAGNRNNIVIPEIKLVDPLFLKVTLNQQHKHTLGPDSMERDTDNESVRSFSGQIEH
jgi:hypothetical protein